jgi:heat shock protein HslJ
MTETPLSKVAGPLVVLAATMVILTRLVVMLTIPATLGDPLKAAVLTPIYTINSVMSIVAFALLVLALVAIYERQARAAGWLGLIGFAAALTGTVFMAGDWWYEAFAVPWMADVAPVVFQTGAGGPLLLGGLTSFALFALGWVLFGAASLRARVFPRAISAAILLTGLIAGIPIAGAYLYGSLGFGLAIGALGLWLMRPTIFHHRAHSVVAASIALLISLAIAGCQSGDSLAGPTWQWTAQSGNPESYTIEFRTDGTVEVSADCNTVSGTYTVGVPLDLTIDVPSADLAACGDPSLDGTYFEDLGRVSSYSTDGGGLRLYFDDEAGAMQFRSAGS